MQYRPYYTKKHAKADAENQSWVVHYYCLQNSIVLFQGTESVYTNDVLSL